MEQVRNWASNIIAPLVVAAILFLAGSWYSLGNRVARLEWYIEQHTKDHIIHDGADEAASKRNADAISQLESEIGVLREVVWELKYK